MLTLDQLVQIMPYSRMRAPQFIDAINASMDQYLISANPHREAAFLAQVAHESAELRYVRELASGAEYEGRKDLGNTEPGDGVRYKGRGLIQITGRANYYACGVALKLPLIDKPELLEAPLNATESAAWFWKLHGLNELADIDYFETITKRINGGLNGYDKRVAYWNKAKQVLGLS